MNVARHWYTATRLPSGKVLVVGGTQEGVEALTVAEIFDPATGTWSRTGSLATARAQHTATLLPSGKVLVAGGWSSVGISTRTLDSAEVYDPATGNWSPTGSLARAHYGYQATLLLSGKVLVVGLQGAELFDPARGVWRPTGKLGTARMDFAMAQMPSGQVLVAGGWNVDSGWPALSSAEVYDPVSESWSATGSMAAARRSPATALLPSGAVLVAGGVRGFSNNNNWEVLASSEVYDPSTGRWRSVAPLSSPRRGHTATVLASGQVLVMGGMDARQWYAGLSAGVEVYDPTKGVWTTVGPIATARAYHTALLLASGKVLIAGGADARGDLASAELYDPGGGTWEAASPLTTGRSLHTETLLLSGKMLVVGGLGSGGALGSAELYEPSAGRWSAVRELGAARHSHSASMMRSGKVLVAGGIGDGGPLSSVEVYDPEAGAWGVTGELATARARHTATVLASGSVLVVGGTGSDGPLASAELYDPSSGRWTSAGALWAARAGHTATLLPSGRVLIAGGQGDRGVLASAEVYDPSTRAWTPVAALTSARAGHSATLLTTGRVLVAGGQSAGGASLAGAELFDPAAGAWSASGALATARAWHTVTALGSGKVLVAGGQATGGVALANAEIYDPALGRWSTARPLAVGRMGHSTAILASGGVLITGGTSGGSPLASAEEYDSAEGASSASGPLADPRSGHTATLLPSGKVLIAGGVQLAKRRLRLASTELYDPVAEVWSTAGALASARYHHTATLLVSGKVLVVGGWDNSTVGNGLASAEVFDAAAGVWSTTGTMATERAYHTATLLPSGKVLVAGGVSEIAAHSSEIHDPVTGAWRATGSLAEARCGHTATLLPSGKVLVVGGRALQGALDSAEVFDPETERWSATGSLQIGRSGHTATLLPSGKVLVAGGYGGDHLASSEMFDPATGTWSTAAPLATARAYHKAVLLPSGRVLVASGERSGWRFGHNAEVYAPELGAWIPLAALATERNDGASATQLASGKVLVVGGAKYDDYASYFDSALYDEGRGAQVSSSPALSEAPALIAAPGGSLKLEGTLFTGASEGSGGGSRSSPANYPLVQIERQDNEWSVFARVTDFSATSASVALPPSLQPGWHWLRVIVNGVPSAARPLLITLPLTVAPASAASPPKGSLQFTASGGSGSGRTWTLATNASGGSIHPTSGVYSAGPTGGVVDVVQVTDTIGRVATSAVAVTAGVSISAAATTVPPKGSLSFGASGGSGTGFDWSLSTNASGGSIDPNTGAYRAGATGDVSDIVQVVDSLGNIAARSVAVSAAVGISPATASLPPRASLSFAAAGGSGLGYAWSLPMNASGATIDPSTGSYTAGAKGGVTDVIQVADSLGNIATRSMAVTEGVGISPAIAALAPRASLAFAASGGSGAGYRWSLSTNASGGVMNGSTGAYTAGSNGGVTDVVQATDSLGNIAAREISVTPGVTMSPAALSLPPRGSYTFTAAGGGGSGYDWSLAVNGSGGSIDRTSGAYTAGATGEVADVIHVADSLGNTATRSVTITGGVRIAPDSSIAPPKGQVSFVATGGSAIGYLWSFSSNASGGSIGASTGAYTAGPAGGVTDTIQVADSLGNVATVRVSVGAEISISPVTAWLSPRASLSFAATGGSGLGYTWSLPTNASGGFIDPATGAYTAGPTGGVTDVVQVNDPLGNVASRSVGVTAGISMTPAPAYLPPRASVAFSASGGAGAGYTWSLPTNASGGNIEPSTGVYTAGAKGGVKDVAQVADSLGNTAAIEITVTAGLRISPADTSVEPRASISFTASGGSGTHYHWSLAANVSGGSMDSATGVYTAGAAGGTTDVVQVVDSLGNTAETPVRVETPRVSQAVGCACGTTGEVPAHLALGLAALVFRRRRGARL